MEQQAYEKTKQNGFVTLITVVIIGVVGLAVTMSLLLQGADFTLSSDVEWRGASARAFANACAEEALQEIKDSNSFSGTGSIQFKHGFCEFTVINTGGQNRTIRASSTASTAIRKVLITIDKVNPEISVVSWQEVVDF